VRRVKLVIASLLLILSNQNAIADTNPDGSPTGIPGIEFEIIPGVNAPAANGPVDNPGGAISGNQPFVPVPPPLFNDDGSPFVPGSPLPGFDQSTYAYDPLTNMYVPLAPGDARPNPVDPYAGLVPLAPPLFNSDGTPFIPGSPLEMPERADGVKFSYVWDPATGLYMPTKPDGQLINSNVEIKSFYGSDGSFAPDGGPITASLISVKVFDQVTGKEVSVTYRSNMPPVINPDGTTNDANVIGAKPFDLSAPPIDRPKNEQIGTWAVLDKNGVVINTIECSETLCGEDGKYGGEIEEPSWAKGGCPDGCKLVLQIPANPITGLSMGGFVSSATSKVTYKNGRFSIEEKEGDKSVIRTLKNGIITDYTGERVDLSTGIQLPSAIKDSNLRKQVDSAIKDAELEPIKIKRGYKLATDIELPAIDSSLKLIAIKSGSKARNLKLSVDKTGELFIPTKADLAGYEIQIKRGFKVLNSIDIE
jgi:hypothetical protein